MNKRERDVMAALACIAADMVNLVPAVADAYFNVEGVRTRIRQAADLLDGEDAAEIWGRLDPAVRD